MNLRLRINMGFLLIVLVMAIVAGVIICQQAKMQTAFLDSLRTCDLDKYLLECRRQEKNYICCKSEQEALNLFQANYDTLYTMTTNLSDDIYDDNIIEELSGLQENLNHFYTAFMQAVQYRDDELNQNQFNISSRACVKYARECHSNIKHIRLFSTERFETALAISSIVNTFSVIIGLFLAVIISSFIADKIMDLIGTPEGELIKYSHTKKVKKNK